MRTWLPGLRRRLQLRRMVASFWYLSPPLLLTVGFVLLALLGTLLLRLPVATREPMGWLDTLFTAAAAITVTGYSVVDTAAVLSNFGQAVVLVLVQLGGIGLMTFAALTVLLLNGRLGPRGHRAVREAMKQSAPMDIGLLLKRVTLLALGMEAAGLVLLALFWVPEMGWGQGLWYSLFHSVSAFNNGGIALRPDSLMGFVGDPGVMLVIAALFIIGGLGFTVVLELGERRRWHQFSLHTRLTLAGTAMLMVGATVLVLLFEWNNPGTLGALGNGDKWLAAWFQSVVPRSAGFEHLDIGALTLPTTLMVMFLAVVGGGSNSTASGIKVSTLMVVLLSTRAFLMGRRQVGAFGRAVPSAAVFRAHVVTILSLMVILLTIFLLAAFEPHLAFLDIAFEAFSVFGNAGLSRGITGELSVPSQWLLMIIMFVGRIGPLALAFALARPRPELVRYPEDEVQIG